MGMILPISELSEQGELDKIINIKYPTLWLEHSRCSYIIVIVDYFSNRLFRVTRYFYINLLDPSEKITQIIQKTI